MARRCVFCDSGPVTKEHVFPSWLRDVLPGSGSFTITQVHTGVPERQWTSDALDKTVKRVCGRCNSTWMSDLEGRARPVLIPFIRGESRSLSLQDQPIVARWAVKTAMMYELGRLGDDSDSTPVGHRQEVYAQGKPPLGSSVWVGAYEGTRTITTHQECVVLRTSQTEGTGFATTMTIGHLLLQTFWFWDYPDGIEIRRGQGLPRVWPDPAGDITLPPPVSDAELDRLAVSFLKPTKRS